MPVTYPQSMEDPAGQPTCLLQVIYKVFSYESGTELPSTSRGRSLGNALHDPGRWDPNPILSSPWKKCGGREPGPAGVCGSVVMPLLVV